MKRLITTLMCCLCVIFAHSQQITQAEYFVDTDPGVGNGTPIAVLSPGDAILESFTIPTASLSIGNHYVWVRTKNDLGVWSHYYDERFYVYDVSAPIPIVPQPPIVAAEYFIDIDPGNGNGTPITISTSGNSIFESFDVPTGSLSVGNHYLWIRTKNANGTWSHYMDRLFSVYETTSTITIIDQPTLVAAEYFVDTDPGVGNGTPIPVVTGDTIGVTFNINVLPYTVGNHFLYIRSKNAEGVWGIPIRQQFDIQVYPLGGIVSENNDVTCFGGCDGSAIVTPTGGLPVWNFAWYTSNFTPMGITDSIATNLCAGTYNCIIIDGNNDRDTIEVVIAQPSQFLATPNPTLASCGADNGIAAVNITGGTAPYTYLWGNNETTPTLINLVGNNLYPVTVTDLNGCTANANVFVSATPAISVTLSSEEPSCHGFCDGSLTPVINGGTAPYSYFWSNASTDPVLSNVCAGNYSVNVTDNVGCIATSNSIVQEPTALSVSVNVTSADCSTANGNATANVTGGTSPYAYSWTSGSNLNTASNLTSGIYQVMVTDQNNCVISGTALISDGNGPVVSVTSVTNPSCHNSVNGAINITTTGSSPFTYLWSNGSTTEDVTMLAAGPYEVVVTDINGCNTIQNATLVAPSPISANIAVFPANCANADGVFMATVFGGTAPFTYSWSTGGSMSTEPGVPMGLHSVIITDANLCQYTSLAVMSEANGPNVTIASIQETQCGVLSGGINISATGGTGTYSYLWSNGASTQNLSNVGSGIYQVTVTDQANCSGLAVAEIPSTAPSIQQICLVTVDQTTGTNLVVWEKPANQGGIESFNIYRETSQFGVFQFIANQPYAVISEYTDPIANPQIRSWRYKISAVDTCGNESPLSPYHKTIHLVLSQFGADNFLNWDHYEGMSFSSYTIWKYTDQTGWVDISTLPSNLTSFTDVAATGTNVDYYIEVVAPDMCTTTKANINTSRSNTKGTVAAPVDGIASVLANQVSVYPNPTNHILNVSLPEVLLGTHYTITNTVGQVMWSSTVTSTQLEISLSELSNGVYYLQLTTHTGIITKKIVKN
jgi:hypothetical protein